MSTGLSFVSLSCSYYFLDKTGIRYSRYSFLISENNIIQQWLCDSKIGYAQLNLTCAKSAVYEGLNNEQTNIFIYACRCNQINNKIYVA